jgi:hypothetical protein
MGAIPSAYTYRVTAQSYTTQVNASSHVET